MIYFYLNVILFYLQGLKFHVSISCYLCTRPESGLRVFFCFQMDLSLIYWHLDLVSLNMDLVSTNSL